MRLFYCNVQLPLLFVSVFHLPLCLEVEERAWEMHQSEPAESVVLICVVYCTVSASRENGKLNRSFLSHRRSVCRFCAFAYPSLIPSHKAIETQEV